LPHVQRTNVSECVYGVMGMADEIEIRQRGRTAGWPSARFDLCSADAAGAKWYLMSMCLGTGRAKAWQLPIADALTARGPTMGVNE
jgi:hypothetical protein